MDKSLELQQQLEQAVADQQVLNITAGNSKQFIGRKAQGQTFSLSGHSGLVQYDARELVVTVRAATPLDELQQALAAEGQYLPFEPPSFASTATIGGTLACGLSGPSRPYLGSARDYLLGTVVLNGQAQQLTFGGQVMKNVAGYDLSRLMVGAMGTLGILLQCSLKVLPQPPFQQTLVLSLPANQAIERMNRLAADQHPISASCYFDGRLYVRLSGFEASVNKSIKQIGGEVLANGNQFWRDLNEQQLSFFSANQPLWRLSLPATAEAISLAGEHLIDWGGAQRWFKPADGITAEAIFEEASRLRGHASCFRSSQPLQQVYQPLPPAMLALQQRLKKSLDPMGLFNPGRMYAEI